MRLGCGRCRGTVLARGIALLPLGEVPLGSKTEVNGRSALAERVAQRVQALRHEGPAGVVGHAEVHADLAGPGVQLGGDPAERSVSICTRTLCSAALTWSSVPAGSACVAGTSCVVRASVGALVWVLPSWVRSVRFEYGDRRCTRRRGIGRRRTAVRRGRRVVARLLRRALVSGLPLGGSAGHRRGGLRGRLRGLRLCLRHVVLAGRLRDRAGVGGDLRRRRGRRPSGRSAAPVLGVAPLRAPAPPMPGGPTRVQLPTTAW